MPRSREPTWTPKPEDFTQVLYEQNPWHGGRDVPEAWAPPVERPLAGSLWQRLQSDEPHRFQLVLGPRRVGKTTAMYQTVRHLLAAGVPPRKLWWLRLDHPLLIQVSLDKLVHLAITTGRASPEEPVYLFLDELVYARDWDLWLKTFYDETWPIRIAGSSSATAAPRERRLESGVGRWEEQYLAPYLFTEYLELVGRPVDVPLETSLAGTIDASIQADINVSNLEEPRRRFLLTGGFPELLISGKAYADETSLLLQSQRTLRNDAVERAIYKDIPQAFRVGDPILLERLLYTLAGQIAGLLSPNKICKTLSGTTQPTFDLYLSYLERAFLVFTLPNYSGSEASRQRRGRKLYFVDGAVRNAALQRGIQPLSDPHEMGLLLENMVAGHLHALSLQSQVRLYHWRDGNDEVDIIYDHPEHPLAFEIASSPAHGRYGLRRFVERFPRFSQKCFLVTPQAIPRRPADNHDGIGSIPLDLLLLATGAQAEMELKQRLAP